ncbi:hypothetical protein C8Q77DRAFT_859462 [Trametes polyzona]|nr:hypothetical protein C8Q77DRAFT_859462 [Trametes polyzona]
MQTPRLNDDVLLHVLSLSSSKPTICALMRTNRLFYHFGAKYLLAEGVTLRNEQQIESFIYFMLAELDFRIPLLRTLTIKATSLPPAIGESLELFFYYLSAKGSLCSLMLSPAETLLRSYPKLVCGIAIISSLNSLTLYDIGPFVEVLMGHLRSQLVYADLRLPVIPRRRFAKEEWEEQQDHEHNDDATAARVPFPDAYDDALPLLRQSTNTLRQLQLTTADDGFLRQPPVFHKVVTLTLSVPNIDEACTRLLVRAFPNLRELTTCDFSTRYDEFDLASFEDMRDSNYEDQLASGTWPSLLYYDGTLAVLFALGIACPITWLTLSNFDYPLEPEMLTEVLHCARPVHLELTLYSDISLFDCEPLAFFGAAGVQKLQTLFLTIYLEVDDLYMTIEQVLVRTMGRSVPRACSADNSFSVIRTPLWRDSYLSRAN